MIIRPYSMIRRCEKLPVQHDLPPCPVQATDVLSPVGVSVRSARTLDARYVQERIGRRYSFVHPFPFPS